MGEERQSVLIVADNPMTEGQLKGIFYRRKWETIVCEDGDKAVDEYVEHKPDLVLLSLDIPGLDGHLAALEMRETDYDARIAFVTSRTRLDTAEDAAFSAGATAVLVTPVTAGDVDEKCEAIMGEVPGAPGLADLDELYPEMEPEPLVMARDAPHARDAPGPSRRGDCGATQEEAQVAEANHTPAGDFGRWGRSGALRGTGRPQRPDGPDQGYRGDIAPIRALPEKY